MTISQSAVLLLLLAGLITEIKCGGASHASGSASNNLEYIKEHINQQIFFQCRRVARIQSMI